MSKYIIVFIVVGIVSDIMSQELSIVRPVYTPQLMIEYQHMVDQAELWIVRSEYKKAFKLYDKALSIRGVNYNVQDLHNALLLSIAIGNSTATDRYVDFMRSIGLCDQYFTSVGLTNNAKSKTNIYNSRALNKKYRNGIDSLFDLKLKGNESDDEFFRKKIDTILIHRFTELVYQYGYPADVNVGVVCMSDHGSIRMNSDIIEQLSLSLLQFPASQQLFDQGLETYALNPYDYIRLHTNTILQNEIKIDPVIKIKNNYYIFKMSNSDKSKINATRGKYGIMNIDDQVEIIKFNIKLIEKNADPQYTQKTNQDKFLFNMKARILELPSDMDEIIMNKFELLIL